MDTEALVQLIADYGPEGVARDLASVLLMLARNAESGDEAERFTVAALHFKRAHDAIVAAQS